MNKVEYFRRARELIAECTKLYGLVDRCEVASSVFLRLEFEPSKQTAEIVLDAEDVAAILRRRAARKVDELRGLGDEPAL